MQDLLEVKKELEKLKSRLAAEKDKIEDIEILVGKKIERDAGLWEYDFEELEKEMWERFAALEKYSDCTTEAELFASKRILASFFRRVKKWYRTLSSPFSRSILDKKKQFNLDQQNRVNQENIPFHLALILSLQIIKDRLNMLEENAQKLKEDHEELFKEIYTSAKKSPGKEKGGSHGKD